MTVLFTVLTVMMEGGKTSCSQPRVCLQREREWLSPGSAGSLPAVFGSLANQQTSFGTPDDCRLAACAPNEPARDLLLVFFESTLHVSPDQQLSALQPLTK